MLLNSPDYLNPVNGSNAKLCSVKVLMQVCRNVQHVQMRSAGAQT